MLSTKLTIRDYGYDIDKRQIPVSSILYIASWCLVPEPLQAGPAGSKDFRGCWRADTANWRLLDEIEIDNHHRRIFE